MTPGNSGDGTAAATAAWRRDQLAALIDHTLLRPEASREDALAAAKLADELGAHAVCIAPSALPVRPERAAVCTVIGFPTGKHHALIKAMEARLAVEQGATELDVVMDYAPLLAGETDAALAELAPVRDAAPGVTLKVICEAPALYAQLAPEQADERLTAACEAAVRAGADYVKTASGMHPAGGATERAVRVMRAAVPDRVGVKAAGGIRTAAQAIALIEAGATRLGTSHTATLLAELAE